MLPKQLEIRHRRHRRRKLQSHKSFFSCFIFFFLIFCSTGVVYSLEREGGSFEVGTYARCHTRTVQTVDGKRWQTTRMRELFTWRPSRVGVCLCVCADGVWPSKLASLSTLLRSASASSSSPSSPPSTSSRSALKASSRHARACASASASLCATQQHHHFTRRLHRAAAHLRLAFAHTLQQSMPKLSSGLSSSLSSASGSRSSSGSGRDSRAATRSKVEGVRAQSSSSSAAAAAADGLMVPFFHGGA